MTGLAEIMSLLPKPLVLSLHGWWKTLLLELGVLPCLEIYVALSNIFTCVTALVKLKHVD